MAEQRASRLTPDAAVVEIIERSHKSGGGSRSIIVPNDVRINGVSVLVPDEPIVVHEIDLDSRDAARVTLTLFARRITIGAEDDD